VSSECNIFRPLDRTRWPNRMASTSPWYHGVRELGDLWARIVEAVGTMLQRTWAEFDCRLDILYVTNGSHVKVYWFFKLNFVRRATDICQWLGHISIPYFLRIQ
jgi:hypothetical protein